MNWIERKALEHFMIPHLKKFWLTYGAVIGGAVVWLEPGVRALIVAHPEAAASVLLGIVIKAFHSTAPKDAKKLGDGGQ